MPFRSSLEAFDEHEYEESGHSEQLLVRTSPSELLTCSKKHGTMVCKKKTFMCREECDTLMCVKCLSGLAHESRISVLGYGCDSAATAVVLALFWCEQFFCVVWSLQ